jgi:hypothetical protein
MAATGRIGDTKPTMDPMEAVADLRALARVALESNDQRGKRVTYQGRACRRGWLAGQRGSDAQAT